jgi:GTPase SAR1 family protein
MRRVLVMGCSGSGKSTFARRLADRTYRDRQRPKQIAYLAGLRADQRLFGFTQRAQVQAFLAEMKAV